MDSEQLVNLLLELIRSLDACIHGISNQIAELKAEQAEIKERVWAINASVDELTEELSPDEALATLKAVGVDTDELSRRIIERLKAERGL